MRLPGVIPSLGFIRFCLIVSGMRRRPPRISQTRLSEPPARSLVIRGPIQEQRRSPVPTLVASAPLRRPPKRVEALSQPHGDCPVHVFHRGTFAATSLKLRGDCQRVVFACEHEAGVDEAENRHVGGASLLQAESQRTTEALPGVFGGERLLLGRRAKQPAFCLVTQQRGNDLGNNLPRREDQALCEPLRPATEPSLGAVVGTRRWYPGHVPGTDAIEVGDQRTKSAIGGITDGILLDGLPW